VTRTLPEATKPSVVGEAVLGPGKLHDVEHFGEAVAALGDTPTRRGDRPGTRRIGASRALGLAIALQLNGARAHGQSLPTFSAHELLDAHNSARAHVGTRPLAWSSALASLARRWAQQLLATHTFTQQPDNPHGENLLIISGGAVTPAEVVQTWVAERGDYDPDSNVCAGVCRHYTQVVWRTTRAVGCGMAFDGNRQVWVCEYDPPGNVAGARPY
jgi:pathogenesis-related protein 1